MGRSCCMRCARLAPTRPYAGNLLWLCEACPLAPSPCPAFQHAYRGSATPGTWVCEVCGLTKRSEPISTEAVPVAGPAHAPKEDVVESQSVSTGGRRPERASARIRVLASTYATELQLLAAGSPNTRLDVQGVLTPL